MRAVFAFAFVVVCLLLTPGLAGANEDPDTEVARRHFNNGRAFYDGAEYQKALDEFEAARRVRPHPALDYNIARCLDRLERYQPAIDAYHRYIASNPPDIAEMRERVKVLEQRLAEAPPTPPVTPPTEKPPAPIVIVEQAPPPPPRSNKRTVAIVLGVLGGAILIGAGVAIGLLVKPTTQPFTPDSTGGPHPATP